jgi:hypothetical protein
MAVASVHESQAFPEGTQGVCSSLKSPGPQLPTFHTCPQAVPHNHALPWLASLNKARHGPKAHLPQQLPQLKQGCSAAVSELPRADVENS